MTYRFRHDELTWMVTFAFGIRISEEERVTCTSPWHITELVCSKVPMGGPHVPMRELALQHVRKALAGILHRPPEAFPTSARIAGLFPEQTRKELWAEFLRRLYPLSLRDFMARPSWVVRAIFLVGVAAGVGGGSFMAEALHGQRLWPGAWFVLATIAGTVAMVAVVAALFWLTRPLRDIVVWDSVTVADMSERIMGTPSDLKRDDPRWTREQVHEVVRELVANRLNVPVEEVHETRRLLTERTWD